ncbi:alpha/beta hydrolase [Actinoplanes sp. NPDC026619]|uniref:alpha/beta hydrolase n=1 Tax=Actinoplanes sp. NPDC026619 TaxID=3155798 RepID=UPI0033E844C0
MDILKPLVLPVTNREAERHGTVDLYPPDDVTTPRPAVLFVHGGPLPAEMKPTPREWPMFQAYGSLVAGRGVVGATVDHGLRTPADYATPAGDVRAAVELIRADPRVDGNRIALWFFSGGSPLSADYLREPPAWLRCVAFSYPLLAPLPGWPSDPRFLPAEAVTGAGDLPIVLTRVGREDPAVQETVRAFVDAAKTRLDIVEVPNGQHSFDIKDDEDASRAAIQRAVDLVLATMK